MAKRDTISITIRLPKELVRWIDSNIDNIDFRNRTHVIEKALCEYKKKRDSSIHHKIME
jgi:Arc/MetJ-type ribon-helix-helix transcriptional regulator